eukprot:356951-Chlamydomonas_euryale.AAC.2
MNPQAVQMYAGASAPSFFPALPPKRPPRKAFGAVDAGARDARCGRATADGDARCGRAGRLAVYNHHA